MSKKQDSFWIKEYKDWKRVLIFVVLIVFGLPILVDTLPFLLTVALMLALLAGVYGVNSLLKNHTPNFGKKFWFVVLMWFVGIPLFAQIIITVIGFFK